MNIQIQSPGFTVSPELNVFIHEKVSKLFNHSTEIISISLMLKVANSVNKENKVCEIRVAIPGNDILASAQCSTFEEAVLEIISTIKTRIKRKKSKIIGTRNDINPEQLHS
jgi:ribosomal subunit interface protein